MKEFDGVKEDWSQRGSQYVERLGHFFVADGFDDAGQRTAVFGCRSVELPDLVAPKKPGEKTYDELIDARVDRAASTP